jgi:probable F420-dependent oxidoreductase
VVAAAEATQRCRVGTLVLNTSFYRPALLARDAVTTAELLDGRLELGLGSGHMKSEFDEAGLPWHPPDHRVDQLEQAIAEIGRRRDDPVPPPPPARNPSLSLLIGGNSDRVLRLAAEHADVVGFAGLIHARGHPPGTFRLLGAEAMDERVAYFTQHAAHRAGGVEAQMLIQKVAITNDPRGEVERWKQQLPQVELGVDELLHAPQLLVGTTDGIIAQVREQRERYGFSYFTVFEDAMDAFAPIVEALAGC